MIWCINFYFKNNPQQLWRGYALGSSIEEASNYFRKLNKTLNRCDVHILKIYRFDINKQT